MLVPEFPEGVIRTPFMPFQNLYILKSLVKDSFQNKSPSAFYSIFTARYARDTEDAEENNYLSPAGKIQSRYRC